MTLMTLSLDDTAPSMPSEPSEPMADAADAHDPRAAGLACLDGFREPVRIIETPGVRRCAERVSRDARLPMDEPTTPGDRVIGLLPGLYPEWLGSQAFCQFAGCRFPYVVGEMARGIATADMVIAAGQAGFFGFFGSAGLRPEVVAPALRKIATALNGGQPWGANLIHSPDDPAMERRIVDLFIEHQVRHVSASAYLRLGREIVRYSAVGLRQGDNGQTIRDNHVYAKVSRASVAQQFLKPPPAKMLRELVQAGDISEQQAEMQSQLPVAAAITVEADSGGHTDNRHMAALFPTVVSMRDAIAREYAYTSLPYLGAAGGLGTPTALAAAFGLGADYVVTGSINQSAIESGLSEPGRAMLADVGMADVVMAPAADMFEIGAKVQVVSRGTMFASKGQRLYAMFRQYESLDQVPTKDRTWLETKVFGESIDEAWSKTRAYLETRNPRLVARCLEEPKQKMAALMRRYLFLGAQWARDGEVSRKADYQIWCGPAMGAFNDWVKGSFLEELSNRTVAQIGLNLLEGAARATRAQQLRSVGVSIPADTVDYRPRPLALGTNQTGPKVNP